MPRFRPVGPSGSPLRLLAGSSLLLGAAWLMYALLGGAAATAACGIVASVGPNLIGNFGGQLSDVDKYQKMLDRTLALRHWDNIAKNFHTTHGSTVKSGGDAAAYARYKGKLWETIAKNQVAPATTRQAIVKISFKVAPDGQLLSWQILSNTGTKAHEDATIKALRKSAPFPAMPVEIAGMPSEFDVDFRFGLR